MARRADHNWHLPWDQYLATLKPHERPTLPGSPATPSSTDTATTGVATKQILGA